MTAPAMTTPAPRKRKPKSEKEAARNREYQKERYEANKEQYKQERKERYDTDPEYRRGIKLRARKSRWLGERLEAKDFPPFGVLANIEPAGEIEIDGQTVKVYSTGAVAELLGRTTDVLRLWWKRKQMPEPFHRGSTIPNNMVKGRNPRLFTQDEMESIDAVKEMLNLPSKGAHHKLFTEKLSEEFAKLEKGLRVYR